MKRSSLLFINAAVTVVLGLALCSTFSFLGASEVPDSVAGRHLRAFLEALGTDDEKVHERFVEEHFVPEEERTTPLHHTLMILSLVHRDTGGGVVREILSESSTSITALVETRSSSKWMQVQLSLSPDPPHGLTSFGLELVPPPVADELQGLSDEEIVEALKVNLEELADASEFSGAVLLARDDEILFEAAYGLASRRFQIPNRTDTKFNLGSMNKMFTGLAIVQLAAAEKLDFEDLVGKHLADYPNPEVASKVTIHHLLTHTSGMESYWAAGAIEDWAQIRTLNELVPLFADTPLAFAPGERFNYSNSGFIVLGLIVEAASGMSYYDYVREHITGPAGMTDTECFEMDKPVPNLAIGYTTMNPDGSRSGEARNNLFVHTVKGGSAGGGFSTLRDLLKFSRALAGHKLLDAEWTQVLLEGKVDTGPNRKYAYGFSDKRANGYRVVGHNGGGPGIGAELRIYPDTGYTLIVFSNLDPDAMMKVGDFAGGLLTSRK